MVMFETLAIVLLMIAFPKRHTGGIIAGLALLIVAGYTKQLAAITAIAALAWMILRNPRRGLLWSIGFALTGSLIFLWMILDTNGEWWRQAIAANVNEFYPAQTTGLFRQWFRLHRMLTLVAAACGDVYSQRYAFWACGQRRFIQRKITSAAHHLAERDSAGSVFVSGVRHCNAQNAHRTDTFCTGRGCLRH